MQMFWVALKTLGVLIAILALAALATKTAARKLGFRERGLKMVDSMPLGPGKQICIVKAGAQYLLLGIGDKSVSHLATFTADDLGEEFFCEIEALHSGAQKHEPFAAVLDRIRSKRG